MQYSLSGVMTRHGGLYNAYHTRYHSIATYDMVQESVPLRFSFILVHVVRFSTFYHDMNYCSCDALECHVYSA